MTRTDGPTRGVVRPRPHPDPRLRLVVLHHAGGSHMAFRRWARMLPGDWEPCLFDAPGRGHLAHVPPVRSMPELVDGLVERVIGLADRPFAVFGHSMGALVGYALTAELHARGLPLPLWLGVSAHPGPRVPGRRAPMNLHHLGFQELRVALHHIGGIPPGLLHDDPTWELVEPLVRADLEVSERWISPADLRVPVPVSAFCGRSDPVAGAAAMQRWGAHTERFLGVRAYDGDHFYFRDAPAELVADIVDGVDAAHPGHTTPLDLSRRPQRVGGPAVVEPARS